MSDTVGQRSLGSPVLTCVWVLSSSRAAQMEDEYWSPLKQANKEILFVLYKQLFPRSSLTPQCYLMLPCPPKMSHSFIPCFLIGMSGRSHIWNLSGQRELNPSWLQNSFIDPSLPEWLCGFCDISSDCATTEIATCSAWWQKGGDGVWAALRTSRIWARSWIRLRFICMLSAESHGYEIP